MPGLRRAKLRSSSSRSPGSRFCSQVGELLDLRGLLRPGRGRGRGRRVAVDHAAQLLGDAVQPLAGLLLRGHGLVRSCCDPAGRGPGPGAWSPGRPPWPGRRRSRRPGCRPGRRSGPRCSPGPWRRRWSTARWSTETWTGHPFPRWRGAGVGRRWSGSSVLLGVVRGRMGATPEPFHRTCATARAVERGGGRALPALVGRELGRPPGASLRLGRARRPNATRGSRAGTASGEHRMPLVPRRARSETERPVQPAPAKRGGRRSAKAATPSASSPPAMVSRSPAAARTTASRPGRQ